MLHLGERKFSGLLNPDQEELASVTSALFGSGSNALSIFRAVFDGEKLIGGVCWNNKGKLVEFDLAVTEQGYVTQLTYFHTAALAVNQIIKDYHPDKLIYSGINPMVRKALMQNLFYPKGRILQRIVEPYRYAVKDRAFDHEGYIINQGLLEVLPFGFFDTRSRGCGWIAAYNLLKINGREQTMFDVANAVGDRDLVGEMFGHSVYALFLWLKKQGLQVSMVQLVKEACIDAIGRSSCGILLYFHKHGAHYTTYHKAENGLYHFYNAVYGEEHLVLSAQEFMDRFTVSPLSYLIWMKNTEIQ